ncbi:hypothetical protein BST61_g10043 [Cercospora zeina]
MSIVSPSEMQLHGAQSFQIQVSMQMATPPVRSSKGEHDFEKMVSKMMNAPLNLCVNHSPDWPGLMRLDKPYSGPLRKFHDESVLTRGTKGYFAVHTI